MFVLLAVSSHCRPRGLLRSTDRLPRRDDPAAARASMRGLQKTTRVSRSVGRSLQGVAVERRSGEKGVGNNRNITNFVNPLDGRTKDWWRSCGRRLGGWVGALRLRCRWSSCQRMTAGLCRRVARQIDVESGQNSSANERWDRRILSVSA